MSRIVVCAAILTFWCAWPYVGMAQELQARPPVSPDGIVTDQALGITFLRIAPAVKQDGVGYRMHLQGSGGSLTHATAEVSVSDRPYVDLSGTYGGILYLDDVKADFQLENRVMVDSVTAGGLQFRREYWVVYGGMGGWEGVINCYALHDQHFYHLSLDSDASMGKPGEVVGAGTLIGEQLRMRFATMLQDGREPVVRRFNELLSSFRVSP